jgi:hypothetical protein
MPEDLEPEEVKLRIYYETQPWTRHVNKFDVIAGTIFLVVFMGASFIVALLEG